MPAGPGELRPRYARVLSPGDDCNVYDLALTVVLRAMILAVFVTQVVFAGSELWRTVAIVISVLWAFWLVESIRRFRHVREHGPY